MLVRRTRDQSCTKLSVTSVTSSPVPSLWRILVSGIQGCRRARIKQALLSPQRLGHLIQVVNILILILIAISLPSRRIQLRGNTAKHTAPYPCKDTSQFHQSRIPPVPSCGFKISKCRVQVQYFVRGVGLREDTHTHTHTHTNTNTDTAKKKHIRERKSLKTTPTLLSPLREKANCMYFPHANQKVGIHVDMSWALCHRDTDAMTSKGE